MPHATAIHPTKPEIVNHFIFHSGWWDPPGVWNQWEMVFTSGGIHQVLKRYTSNTDDENNQNNSANEPSTSDQPPTSNNPNQRGKSRQIIQILYKKLMIAPFNMAKSSQFQHILTLDA